MRDPLGLNERLFAWFYPRLVQRAEDAGQRETRAELIAHARGRTLELGAGSGLNLEHYPEAVSELVLTEPSAHMLAHLRRALDSAPPHVAGAQLVEAGAESLPYPDDRFDTVLATYVLCTVPDPAAVLAEVARVLAPGGRYLFLEHVRAPAGSALATIQDVVAVPHRYIAAGCHPNRRTEAVLDAAPLRVVELQHGRQPRSIPTVRPTIRGWAEAA